MRRKNLDPNSQEVVKSAIDRIRRMTPDEALEFLNYRTPGIEETDMTGMFGDLIASSNPNERDRKANAA